MTSLATFGALFNSQINSLRRRRKDPRGTRRCPESCPAGVAQGPMGTRSPTRRCCRQFLHMQDYNSRQAMRWSLRRWVGTLLANSRRVPCLCGRRWEKERECTERRGREGSALTCANQDAGSARQATHPLWGRASGAEEGSGAGGELQVGNVGRSSCSGGEEAAGIIGRMEGGRGVRIHPGWRSSFPESGQAPGTPSGETCGSGRDRLSLGSSRRCPDGAGGCCRCQATEWRERGPRGREAAEQLQKCGEREGTREADSRRLQPGQQPEQQGEEQQLPNSPTRGGGGGA